MYIYGSVTLEGRVLRFEVRKDSLLVGKGVKGTPG